MTEEWGVCRAKKDELASQPLEEGLAFNSWGISRLVGFVPMRMP